MADGFLSNFISVTIPDTITLIFDKIGSFLDSTAIFFLNAYSILLVLIFFLLFLSFYGLPFYLYNLWLKYKKSLRKIFNL